MHILLLFGIVLIFPCGIHGSPVREETEKTPLHQLDAALTKFLILFLDQEDQFTKFAVLEEIGPVLSDNSTEMLKKWILAPSGTPLTVRLSIQLEQLIQPLDDLHKEGLNELVNNSKVVQYEPYLKARETLQMALNQLDTAISKCEKSPASTVCAEKRFEFRRQKCNSINEMEPIRKLQRTLNVSDKSSVNVRVAQLFSPKFDRVKLTRWAKIIIGDYNGLRLLERGICQDYSHEDTTESIGADLVSAFTSAEKWLVSSWNVTFAAYSQLEEDVRANATATKEHGIFQDPEMKKVLDEKYYWNNFRVHVYSNKFVSAAKSLIEPGNSLFIEVNDYAIIVRWTENMHGGDFYKWDDKESGNLDQSNPQSSPSRTPSQQVNTDPSAAQWGKGISGLGQPGGEMLLAAIKSQKNALDGAAAAAKGVAGTARGFKTALKFIGNVGKFLGPLAAAVCELISVFTEMGEPDVFNKLQEGFDEMHNRFDTLEKKIMDSTEEITDMMKKSFDFYTDLTRYKEKLREKLHDLRIAEKDISPKNLKYRKSKTARANHKKACFGPHGLDQLHPMDLLETLNYFYLSRPVTSFDSFVKHLEDWASDQLTEEVQDMYMNLALDALSVGMLATSACLGVDNPTYNNMLDRTILAAKATREVQRILEILFDSYDRYLYDWKAKIEETVQDEIKSAILATQKGDSPKGKIISMVKEKLSNKFKGKNWKVVAFRDDGITVPISPYDDNDIRPWLTYGYIANPDYAAMINSSSSQWRVFIEWNLASETPVNSGKGVFHNTTILSQEADCGPLPMDEMFDSMLQKGFNFKDNVLKSAIAFAGYYGKAGDWIIFGISVRYEDLSWPGGHEGCCTESEQKPERDADENYPLVWIRIIDPEHIQHPEHPPTPGLISYESMCLLKQRHAPPSEPSYSVSKHYYFKTYVLNVGEGY